jgi:hypothetical protein
MSEFQAQSPDAADAANTRVQFAGGHQIIRRNRTEQQPATGDAPSNRRMTPAPIKRRVIAPPIKRVTPATEATTPAPAKAAHPVTRRVAPPVRTATVEPVAAPTEAIVKPATVDSIERLCVMLEAGSFGPKPEALVLFGEGLYDHNGKPRLAQVALQATTKSKKARRTAPMRKDGFSQKGGLEALANLLPAPEPATDSV